MLFNKKWILTPLKLMLLLMHGGVISAHAALPEFTGTHTIDGTALVDNTLTIIVTGTPDADVAILSYQWLANELPISSSIAASDTLTIIEAHTSFSKVIYSKSTTIDSTIVLSTTSFTTSGNSDLSETSIYKENGYYFP